MNFKISMIFGLLFVVMATFSAIAEAGKFLNSGDVRGWHFGSAGNGNSPDVYDENDDNDDNLRQRKMKYLQMLGMQ